MYNKFKKGDIIKNIKTGNSYIILEEPRDQIKAVYYEYVSIGIENALHITAKSIIESGDYEIQRDNSNYDLEEDYV